MKKQEYTNELNLSLDEAISFYRKICKQTRMIPQEVSPSACETTKYYVKLANRYQELCTVFHNGEQIMLAWPEGKQA